MAPRLGCGIGYALTSRSGGSPAVHGVDAEVRVRVHRRLSVAVGYTLTGAIPGEGASASVRVRRHPLRLGFALELPAGPLRVDAGAGLLADYTRYEAYEVSGDMTAEPGSGHLVLGIAPALGVGLPLWERLLIFAAFRAEIPFNARRYVADTSSGREALGDYQQPPPAGSLDMPTRWGRIYAVEGAGPAAITVQAWPDAVQEPEELFRLEFEAS